MAVHELLWDGEESHYYPAVLSASVADVGVDVARCEVDGPGLLVTYRASENVMYGHRV